MARKLNPNEERMFAEVIRSEDPHKVELSTERLRENLLKRLEASLDLSPDLGLWFTEDISHLPR